jgi:predicted dehydrogenase
MTTTPGHTSRQSSSRWVAAIGYAFMGKTHLNAWRNVASFFDVPAFEQKVLVGRDADGVVAAAANYGWAETATDWRAVLDRDDIHIVDIRTPGWMHAEIAIAALEAGKHVLVERPLANTLSEAQRHGRSCPGGPAARSTFRGRVQLPPRPGTGPGP